MKVAIVSCYFKHNYGSMLQAFATQMALDKLGYDNETIDISGFNNLLKKRKIKYFVKASLTSSIVFSKIGMLKNSLIKKFVSNDYTSLTKVRDQEFERFKNKYFKLSEKIISLKELSEICESNYSSVLVGSDQLWLPGNIAADYYTLSFTPKTVNTVAYATSFGQSTLPRDSSKKAKQFLQRIRHISVREDTGRTIVKALTGRNVPVVCDPTLLFTGEEWLKIQQQAPIYNEKYILCYFLGNNQSHRMFAKRLRQETGYRIIALIHLDEYIKYDNLYADETPYNIDPADFLNLIRNASYICTDSFHGTVFSILYKREFFTFRRYSRNTKQSTNSRIETLLNMAGLNNRILLGDEDVNKYINEFIDFEYVHKVFNKFRNLSYDYLKAALKDEESTDLYDFNN